MKTSSPDILVRRVEEERHQAQVVSKHADKTSDVRLFFEPLCQMAHGEYANVPGGVTLPEFLLASPIGVFNLDPQSAPDFERDLGLDIETVIYLVKELRCLKPNIVNTNPEEWRGMEHLGPLMSEAIVSPMRVQEYLRLRDPCFEDYVRELQPRILQLVPRMSSTERIRFAGSRYKHLNESETFARVLAFRMSYLRILCPAQYQPILDDFDNNNFYDAATRLQISKSSIASPITSAFGGEWFWPPHAIEIRQQCSDDMRTIGQLEFDSDTREVLAFLMSRFDGLLQFPSKCLRTSDLVRFLRNNDLKERRARLNELNRAIAQLAATGEIVESTVEEYVRLYSDICAEFQCIANLTECGLSSLFPICGQALTCWIGPAGYLGHLLPIALKSKTGKRLNDALGNGLHSLLRPERHRFLRIAKSYNEN